MRRRGFDERGVSLIEVMISMGIFAIGILGILRFPDFYTRMHAAGKSDSLGAVLVLVGFALFNLEALTFASILVSIKILFIALFIFVASPTATHAIVQTALVLGAEPWKKGDSWK